MCFLVGPEGAADHDQRPSHGFHQECGQCTHEVLLQCTCPDSLAEEEGDRMSRAWRRMQRSIPQLATVPVPFELAANTLMRSREASHVVEGPIEVSVLERGEHLWRECSDDAGAMRFGRRAKEEDAETVLVGNWVGHADIGMGLGLYGGAAPGRERNVRSRDVRRLRTAMQVRHSLTMAAGARTYLFVCVRVRGRSCRVCSRLGRLQV